MGVTDCHLAKSLATVSLGQVTKAAECVPDVYVSDAMENALSPTVLSSWYINTLRSAVCEVRTQREEEDDVQQRGDRVSATPLERGMELKQTIPRGHECRCV